jgi:hypothetical protein
MGRAENNVTKQVRLAITQMGDRAAFVRVQAGTFTIADRLIRGAEAGTADLIGVYRGVPVAMEIPGDPGLQRRPVAVHGTGHQARPLGRHLTSAQDPRPFPGIGVGSVP